MIIQLLMNILLFYDALVLSLEAGPLLFSYHFSYEVLRYRQVRLLPRKAAASSSTGFHGRTEKQPISRHSKSKVSVPTKRTKKECTIKNKTIFGNYKPLQR